MRTRKWEVNAQKKTGNKTQSFTTNTLKDAKSLAETLSKMGWWNVNWSAETASTEKTVAWVVRNGEKVN